MTREEMEQIKVGDLLKYRLVNEELEFKVETIELVTEIRNTGIIIQTVVVITSSVPNYKVGGVGQLDRLNASFFEKIA
jgi:hypothetical protein